MKFVEQIEIYRLGALCGIYSKQELIKYLDKLIYDLDDIPSEIIEASMLSSKNVNDISDKLYEVTHKFEIDNELIVNRLLHTICKRYYQDEMSLEDSVYYLYKIIKDSYSSERLIGVDLSDEMINTIQYLSDGLDLAEEGIYGDITDIRKEFEKFINNYK